MMAAETSFLTTLASVDYDDQQSTTLNFFDVSLGPELSTNHGLQGSNLTDSSESLDCMEMPKTSQSWSIVCEGILSVIVGLCGLLGNASTIMVLRGSTFKETFHKLLICLSCFDSLFISSAILIYSIRAYGLYKKGSMMVHFMGMALFPIGNMALYGSIYITLAVSIERFLGVVYPMQSRTRPRRNLWAYLLPVLFLSIGFNIPKALEFRLIFAQTTKNETIVQAEESELARDLTYTHYYKVWSNLIVTALVPIVVLVFCNSKIFFELRKSRKEMSVSSRRSNNQDQQEANPDHNLAMILAGIVMVFAVCHFFRFFLAFYHVSIAERTKICHEQGRETAHPPWLYIISALNHLMLMVNSSINFIIYCAVGSKFRQAVMAKLCGRSGSSGNAGGAGNSRANADGNAIPMNGHAVTIVNDRPIQLSTPQMGHQKLAQLTLVIPDVGRNPDQSESRLSSFNGKSPQGSASTAVADIEQLSPAKTEPEIHENPNQFAKIQTLTRVYCEETLKLNRNFKSKTCSATVTDL